MPLQAPGGGGKGLAGSWADGESGCAFVCADPQVLRAAGFPAPPAGPRASEPLVSGAAAAKLQPQDRSKLQGTDRPGVGWGGLLLMAGEETAQGSSELCRC